jgi:hypothetical protein
MFDWLTSGYGRWGREHRGGSLVLRVRHHPLGRNHNRVRPLPGVQVRLHWNIWKELWLEIIGFAKNLGFVRWLGKKVQTFLTEGVKQILQSFNNWNWLLFRRTIEKKSEEFQISHQWYLLFRQYVWIFHI